MAKRFYDQELISDIFHVLKKLVPLRIRNIAVNIKESKSSLIYFVLTLSILVSYLVTVSALGLLRLNPVRDIVLLLLIPITIFVVSKKKRDILSWERIPYSFPKRPRLYLSLHKTLVLTVVLVAMLYPLPKPPEYNFRYYHRSTNEDDFVKVVQEVEDKYPLSEVKMFFDNDIVRGAVRKTQNMVYPQVIEIVETKNILSRIGDKRHNFLFLDRGKEKSESLEKVREWISMYKEQHNSVRLFTTRRTFWCILLRTIDVSGYTRD